MNISYKMYYEGQQVNCTDLSLDTMDTTIIITREEVMNVTIGSGERFVVGLVNEMERLDINSQSKIDPKLKIISIEQGLEEQDFMELSEINSTCTDMSTCWENTENIYTIYWIISTQIW